MAASQLTLLQTTVALPAGPFQLACFVAVAGAIGLSASALFAIRAAILGFAIGLAAVISWLSGPSVATLLAPGPPACLRLVPQRPAPPAPRLAPHTARPRHYGPPPPPPPAPL